MIDIILQLILALLYANFAEWSFHRFILHGLGKKAGSIWAFHLTEHHLVCARNDMLDSGYSRINFLVWNAQTKELAIFAAIILIHLPLLWAYPAFVLTLYASLSLYYVRHRKAHLQPGWAKRYLTWHYEHHLDADSGNWCVTWPWFDHIMGTRSKRK